ncbi:MAG: GTP 3',8-cyclase MoaA [Actinobacteria bacterium]|nr:GTP 3',8-cyclase MoaA [Actinomycetota bacterium]
MKDELTDSFGRIINYLRISITDRCNLRCFYCMPEHGIKLIERSEILSYSEIIRIVKIFSNLGIKKIRITGGEPLTRKGAADFIENLLKTVAGIDMAITTNGIYLDKYIDNLASAGLGGINISLDTLNKDQYCKITRNNIFSPNDIINNIKKALKLGINDIKINSVLTGFDDEKDIFDLINLALNLQIDVKFIEVMQVDSIGGVNITETECGETNKLENDNKTISFKENLNINEKVLNILKCFGSVENITERKGFGPAVYYRLNNSQVNIGVISNSGKHCESCNRIRLTSDGKLKPCLYSNSILDIKKLLRTGSSDSEIINEIKNIIKDKPMNKWSSLNSGNNHNKAIIPEFMNKIGG